MLTMLYPTESSANYQEMLRSLKARGLEQVGLFVSDGIIGLPDAVTEIYPKARHQAAGPTCSEMPCIRCTTTERR